MNRCEFIVLLGGNEGLLVLTRIEMNEGQAMKDAPIPSHRWPGFRAARADQKASPVIIQSCQFWADGR